MKDKIFGVLQRVGREQRYRTPQLGPQRGRDVRYQTRDGAYPGPEGDPSQPGGRQAGSQGYRRSEIIDRSSLRSVAAGRRECFRLAEAEGIPCTPDVESTEKQFDLFLSINL